MTNKKPISKPEDFLIREWVRRKYGVRLRQWTFWKKAPAEAVKELRKEHDELANLTEAEVITAARRNA